MSDVSRFGVGAAGGGPMDPDAHVVRWRFGENSVDYG